MDTPITDLLTALTDQANAYAAHEGDSDSVRLAAADALIGRYEDLMEFLKLRTYTDEHGPSYPGALSEYVVVDLVEGVSTAMQRRADDLYVHVDTTEAPDAVIDFEINSIGGGTFDVP